MRIWFFLTLAAFGSERVKVVQQNSAIWPNYNQIIWWVCLLMTILRVHFLLIPLKKLNPEEQHIIYKLFCHNEGSMVFTFYFQIFSKKPDVSLFLCLWLVQQTIVLSLTNFIKNDKHCFLIIILLSTVKLPPNIVLLGTKNNDRGTQDTHNPCM